MGSPDHDAVLQAATLLQNNGQSTGMTLAAVSRLNRGLDTHAVLIPSWSSLLLSDDSTRTAAWAPVSPNGVNIRRVATAMRVVDAAQDGPLDRTTVRAELDRAAQLPASHAAVFTLACATGAGALAVIFGADHPAVVLLAALSGAVGGALRRTIGRWGAGPLPQVLLAATVAGLIGAAALRADLGPSAALVVLCPVLILVPGPHLLNGALDLLALRVTLGLSRLGYASVLVAAIGAGLMLGLQAGGETLPMVSSVGRTPLLGDVLAAGVAAASYSVYFSMPYRLIAWPVAAGMLAHAAHWWALSGWGSGPATAALIACLIVGVLLVPVSHLVRIPFAGIGFASVVSLIPGSYALHMLGGLVALPGDPSPSLLAATVANGVVATSVVAAMAVGLAIPMHVRDVVEQRRQEGLGFRL